MVVLLSGVWGRTQDVSYTGRFWRKCTLAIQSKVLAHNVQKFRNYPKNELKPKLKMNLFIALALDVICKKIVTSRKKLVKNTNEVRSVQNSYE